MLRDELIMAIETNNIQLVQILIEANADIEARDNQNWTPLAWAAKKNRTSDIASMLIYARANIEARDKWNNTPLIWAAKNKYGAVLHRLLEAGANIEAKNKENQTPLAWAVEKGWELNVYMLLDAKANVEARDCNGQTPLALAAITQREVITQMLLEAKAMPLTQNSQGKTALQLTTSSAIQETVGTAMQRPRNYIFCAGFHPRSGGRSFLFNTVGKHSLFDRQSLRVLFALSGDGGKSSAKKSDQNKKRSRSPSSQ